MNVLRKALLAAIAGYRATVSPVLPASCRFYPSCSRYASEAIETYGVGRGILLSIKRIAKCHPWHAGGVDLLVAPNDGNRRAAGGPEPGATPRPNAGGGSA